MGYSHIIWVNDDPLSIEPPPAEELKAALGEAVFEIISPHYVLISGKPQRNDSAPIFSSMDAVNYCDEVHSSDARLFLWFGNCLRPLKRLEDRELLVCQEMILDEMKRRASNRK